MKFCLVIISFFFGVLSAFAQPANDDCTSAQTVIADGTCYTGTTVGANDSWTGTVGCQSGNGHPDVWYKFTATGTTLSLNLTAGTLAGNIEFILVSGDCINGFTVVVSRCGASPLQESIYSLDPGVTYYYTVSSSTASQGTFTTCVTSFTPPLAPGQDCSNASILCNADSTFHTSSNIGFGTQEVSTTNSCWGIGGERQSKWFKFTAGCTGKLEFSVRPVKTTDDYDWALWNITDDPTGCTTKGNSIACNWSGSAGSTGISSCPGSEPGVVNASLPTGGDPCGPGVKPRAFGNWSAPGGGNSSCITSTINITAGNTYALLVDNFTSTNSGFSLVFGGACKTGTAKIGPDATFTYTATNTCGVYTFTKSCSTNNSVFLWHFGDGNSTDPQNPSHTYADSGDYTVTLQVTDALGCTATYSQTLNQVATAPPPIAPNPIMYTEGAPASALVATGTNLIWYTVPTSGTGSPIAPTPSTAIPGTVNYYVSQTVGGCESPRTQIDVTVAPADYKFIGNGNWSDAAQWLNQLVPPDPLTSGITIVIDPVIDGAAILDVPVVIPTGCSLIIMENKIFQINGNLIIN